jgi:hypothetical protein
MWVDTVAPESQNIVQLFVLGQYIVYCLSILLIFHIGRHQKVVDVLFPPLITLAFAAFYWNVPDSLLIFWFISMLVASCVFSASNAVLQRSLSLPCSFPNLPKVAIRNLIGLALAIAALIFFAERSHELSWLHILLLPVFLGMFVLLYSCIFFYPIFILWFFQEKRKWRAWVLFLVYSAVWVAFIVQTYPINDWWMRTFVDPCYLESMGFDNADYQVISGHVCVQLPGDDGPFNISIRKTLEGADAATFQRMGNSPYYRDSVHVYYGDQVLSMNPDDVVVSEKFLLSGDRLFKYGEAVDIEKETKLFQPDDKSFELRYLDSAFTPHEGDFPIRTVEGSCETARYIWDAFRWGYSFAVMTTGKGCIFQSGENEEFFGEKSINGIPGKLYQSQFNMIWLSESCGGIAYRVVSPRDWDEFFLPQLTLQNRCRKK